MPKISSKLKTLFYLTFFVFIAHIVEEFTALFLIQVPMRPGVTVSLPSREDFIFIEFCALVAFTGSFYLIKRNMMPFVGMLIFGLFYVLQTEHIINAVRLGGYYSGLFTGSILVFIGVSYWRAFSN